MLLPVTGPDILVTLRDGTDTWVTTAPIRQRDRHGAIQAAGEAFALFVSALERDGETVNKHLRRLPR